MLRLRAQRSRKLGVARPNIEVRMLAIVAHEERAAAGQPSIEMHDWQPIHDAIAGLENETAGAFHERKFTYAPRQAAKSALFAAGAKNRVSKKSSGDDFFPSTQGTVRPPSTTSVWPVT
jgi:hypothetical protein